MKKYDKNLDMIFVKSINIQ